MWLWLLFTAAALLAPAYSAGAGAARLVCYVESSRKTDGFSECTHLVYAGDARGDKLDSLLKDYKKNNPKLKVILRISETDKDLSNLLKSKYVQGLEVYNAHKALNRTKVTETLEAARSTIASSGGGPLFLALPSHPELLAKYYDLMTLVKKVDLLMVETHNLGMVKKMTYHPSRLSGMWDMMNTDSVVDLVVGLGVPASKVVISLPATARQFTLANETLSTPGSPAVDDEPKEIDQAELCRQLRSGRWTLERDQDLSAPYAFKDKTWISFEDSSSVDVKGKYARVRGLAGLALHRAERDVDTACGPTLRTALAKVLNQQSRAPRAAVLRSLENEILSAPGHVRALNALQVSPYRITQIVDSDGVIHSIREDTRTEFSCSRQGYFVHPRSCARFYRCVKFDQLSPEFTVFEFDCPAGLAFDNRYEVCVWPGSLPHSQACPGSSEIAPVPKTRFICPAHEGYYADPENCRWFFACLDHGTSPLTAYEFRCPFGLGFDAERLKCDWPWMVPNCGNIGRYEAEAHGFSAAILTGAAGYNGQTADDINVAAHQSLISGASLENHVGIQNGFLTKNDALDSNFITAQEVSNAGHSFGADNGAYQLGDAGLGLVQPTEYNNHGKYSSGSLILDDYRLPTKDELAHKGAYNGQVGGIQAHDQSGKTILPGGYTTGNSGYNGYSGTTYSGHSQKSTDYDSENSGAYVHDPSGDYAEPYRHQDSPTVPYIHDDAAYKQAGENYDYGKYSGSSQGSSGSQYVGNNDGQYVEDNAGAYVETNSGSDGYQNGYNGNYKSGYSDYYNNDDSGKYNAGVYRQGAHIGEGKAISSSNFQQYHGYSETNAGNYINDGKAYTGAPHILTAGAINVGLVGKTTLVDADYKDQNNYHESNVQNTHSYSHSSHTLHPAHVLSHVSQPAVSISHVGTDDHNLDGYSYITTPTSSGIPTTATPFAATTSLPVVSTYKTSFLPEAPKTSIKQVFGVTQPAVTYVQPTAISIKHVTPQVQVTDHNQGFDYQYESKQYNGGGYNYEKENIESGYDYSKPNIKFEDGISYTTAAPTIAVSTFKPTGFHHNQQTLHQVNSAGFDYSGLTPVKEEPFKKVVAYTTGPSDNTYIQPTAPTFTPQSFSHQTIHKVETSNTYLPPVTNNYEHSKVRVTYEEPAIVEYSTPQPAIAIKPIISTYEPQVIKHETVHNFDAHKVNTYSEGSGYNYEKPSVQFEEVNTVYSTPSPIAVSTYKPQSYIHQTIHNVESQKYLPVSTTPKYDVSYQSTPVTIYQNPLTEYVENVTPVTYTKPSYNAHAISHQTVHKVENNKAYSAVNIGSGYEYNKPAVAFQEQIHQAEYTTAQPVVVSTYQPQVYSHQTLHKVDASQFNTYSKDSEGYEYQKPAVKFIEAPKTVFEYSTPAPSGTTYQPQIYSHQTIHKVDAVQINNNFQGTDGYQYQEPAIKYEEEPKTVFKYSTPTPIVTQPQIYSHQTVHKVDASLGQTQTGNGYDYQPAAIKFEEAPTVYEHSTPAPIVTTTYQPHEFSHQTLHKVDTSQVHTYSQENEGYEYKKPALKFVEQPKTVFEYSTPIPVVTSTYRPQTYSHQTVHKVETQKYLPAVSTVEPVTKYENPIIKYTQKVTPVTYVEPTAAVYTQTYKPIIQQHEIKHVTNEPVEYKQNINLNFEGYPYNQPEIQRNIESSKSYSDASLVSHQYYHQSNVNHDSESSKVIISSTPSSLAFESHYAEYESPKFEYKAPEYVPPKVEYKAPEYIPPKVEYKAPEYIPPKVEYKAPEYISPKVEYKAPEYIPPKVEYKAPEYIPPRNDYESYATVSTVSTPVIHQSSVIHKSREYTAPKTYSASTISTPIVQESFVGHTQNNYQNNYDYKFEDYSQQYETVKNVAPAVQKVSFSTSHVTIPQKVESVHFSSGKTEYQQTEYQSPEIQVAYKAEEYLPPVVSTAAPIVTSTYKPRTYYTTTREYLPPAEPTREYLPPSTTARPIIKLTTPSYRIKSTTAYKASEYLPPVEDIGAKVVSYDSFGYKNKVSQTHYNTQEAYTVNQDTVPVHKHNLVVEKAKSNLLGFGTVGPDAGLISESYTTVIPIVSTTYRQRVKSTTPTYRYKSTTAYQAPEYLPPAEKVSEDFTSFGYKTSKYNNQYQETRAESTAAPIYKKQNIVIATAKSELRNRDESDTVFGSPVAYTTSAPVIISSSTYAPEEQGLFGVTPSAIPKRRTKPKVAVVTKINDFNPFLVRKLGAVCSCQSPVLVLKGRRPNRPSQDVNDYNNYEDSGRGDINVDNYSQRYTKVQKSRVKTIATPVPIVTSTFNPIIVPDDSYYQDLQEDGGYDVEITAKQAESYISNAPIVASTTLKPIRSRVKSVTVAPTYKTILLNPASTTTVEEDAGAVIDSQAFDRYGPGGWRSRDETLQGSVDCKRAGLFRHPKQCNKFYACRWDCTKQRFTLHVFNCPVQLSFDPNIGACNWPSQGPACQGDTLLTNVL